MSGDKDAEIVKFWLQYNLREIGDFDVSEFSQFIKITIPDTKLEQFFGFTVWLAPGGSA